MSTPGLGTQPSAATYDLEDLIAEAWSGRIRVPHFQRDYKWTSKDVIRLFDSIVRGYPIGSLLLWVRHSPSDLVRLGALTVEAPETDKALWVVDGQQRVTSLANALHSVGNRKEPFNVYYDLEKREFIPTPKIAESNHIPLPTLFDLEELLSWFAGPGKGASEYFNEARSVAKRLRQYKVPAYLVKQHDEAVLTDIFDRMNNFGKRLSRAEIFSALFAGPEKGASNRLSISKIADRVAARTGFGAIDNDTVLHSILARRGPDITREPRTEFDDSRRRTDPEFPGEDQETAYAEGELALIRAITFLQDEVGVPHVSLLAYRAPLVVFARFFAHFPNPKKRNRKLLRRLYWRVVVAGPAVFKGSFTQMARSLATRIHPKDEDGSVARLLASMEAATSSVPDAKRFRTNEATGRIVLCAWWALRPRSPITGLEYSVEELSDILSEQPAAVAVRRFFAKVPSPRQQFWAANRLILPSRDEPVSEAPGLLGIRPLDIDEDTWDTVLDSHCISREASQRLSADDRDGFLNLRQEAVEDQLRRFISSMAEWTYEDIVPVSLSHSDDELSEMEPDKDW
ncbi:DUF262 domain-containing protein [Kitasatospora sp. NPDC056076]|uniref:DUF262 domain-containing protein n=1 Tax=Kitasatospora sp. NPDC056076 TaxID=3345703 RepID=UPI0035E31F8D